MRLTKRKIESLEYDPNGPAQQIEWDDRLPNFGLRLYKSGAKSFVIRYRNDHGRRRYKTVGRFGRMTLQQARSKALELFVEVDDGQDPVAKERRTNADTVAELVDAFIEKHCKVRRKGSWEEDDRRLRAHVVDRWKARRPESLTRRDLSELHREIGEAGQVEANRVIQVVRAMFGFAADEGIVEDGFNPARRVNLFEEKSRDRWLRPHEIKPMSDALDKLVNNIYLRNYYWLLLLTATRRNELLETRWEHVDLDRRGLHLFDTKNGSDHTVPLSTPAVTLFEELPRLEDNPFVFCSRIRGRHLVEVNQTWRRVRKEAGLDGVVPHDFRRTAASWIAQSGYSMLVVQELLNHKVQGATARYARMRPGAVREAVEDFGRKVMAAKVDNSADVVSLFASSGK